MLSVASAGAQDCVGDCDGDRKVSVAELILGVAISLGEKATSACLPFDRNTDNHVNIDELVTSVSFALNGCPWPRRGTFDISISSGGLERRVLVTVPESLDPEVPAPLVLNFHGVTATSETIQAVTRMPEKAQAEGFITAAPQGVDRSWNAGLCCGTAQARNVDDVGLTRDLIAALQAEFNIDESRVYATGFSNGGAMVYRLACEAPDLFAAVAPVGGALAAYPCAPSAAIPLLIINGVADPIVNFRLATVSFEIWRGLNACVGDPSPSNPADNAACEAYECANGPTALCAVSGISHVWPGGLTDPSGAFDATDAVWEFFRNHQRPGLAFPQTPIDPA